MKMSVSRKNLPLIHLIPRKVATGLDIGKAAHQGVERSSIAGSCSVLLEPFAECRVQSLMLRFGHGSGLLDQRFLGTEGDVLHTKAVYTISVLNSTG